ncbi:glycoside hydrolase family 6 protein [Pseudonocardia sp.]|uniref:glycoside hydrolase family 6 protein n=1 Tax=Pseudonocardia sp. TaxID=60912 RepID=UPI0026069DF7|nr:glycoside hydrolase family 6 protein [Pseudonocardia sp.]
MAEDGGVRVLARPVVPAPRLPLDLHAQVDAHLELAARLPPEPPRFPRRLLTVEIPALLVAVLIAAAGFLMYGGPPGTGDLYVDPTTAAARQVAEWEGAGRAADATLLRQIADRPVPLWLAGGTDVAAVVADYTDRADAAGAVPLLVAYNIPDRDCGSFSGGGAADGAAYRAWVAEVAAGLRGQRDPLVVLEPDAIPHQLTGCVTGADERYALLAHAVDVLAAAGARVYLDAGNPGFVPDVGATADALARSGVRRAAGFSLNVANFYPTEETVAHGTAISQALGGGVRFVVDTSRNGAGRAPEAADGTPSWCNPAGRRLGVPPTTDPGIPLVDALLWVKRPGESDGECRPGEPPAGGWFPEYALELVEG